jgi:hypothetical protein
MEDNTETDKSSFNEASFKMKRLHELQERINLLRRSMFVRTKNNSIAFKEQFDCLLGLYQEIASKCTTTERDEVKEKFKELKSSVRDLVTWRNIKDRQSHGNPDENPKTKLPYKELVIEVEDGLFDCEELIRDLLDKHGFSTMNMEDTAGDPYS